MPRHHRPIVFATAIALLTSCGLLPEDADLPLDGREFESTLVTENGEPVALVEQTSIRVRFGEERISADAGCNSISGEFDVEGDLLVVENLEQTERGCESNLMAQDERVADLLRSQPTVSLVENQLVLDNDLLTVTFLEVDS